MNGFLRNAGEQSPLFLVVLCEVRSFNLPTSRRVLGTTGRFRPGLLAQRGAFGEYIGLTFV